jgi:simple sugar transport system ATP-binding protein
MSGGRGPVRLALRGTTKRYGTVIANQAIDLEVAAGEIHAVLGENGAGKSTLMRIIAGVTAPDAGRIEWQGRPVTLSSPAAARALGIGMVFQHFSLFETLSVAENIALASGVRGSRRALEQRIRTRSADYGLPLDPARLVHDLSVGERQRVELLRCLLETPKLLILDEPTSVLAPTAVEALFATLRRLAAEGVSILYVSHKLDEIRELCDVATVLRAGRVTVRVIPREESAASLARLMLGGDPPTWQLPPRTPGDTRLALVKLCAASDDPHGTPLRAVDLDLRSGEIVGIAGVSGNGQRELEAAVCGELLAGAQTQVLLQGRAVGRLGVAARRQLGLRTVPEQRLGRGAVATLDLAGNCVLTGPEAGLVRRGLVQWSAARAFARATLARFEVRGGGVETAAASLSGGNLQRFIVGREIGLKPSVLLAAQPTSGVDVGAASRIHEALVALRNAGTAVLILSEDLDELFALCDRLGVLAAGRLSPLQPTATSSRETIGRWMSGDFGSTRGDGARHGSV